MLVTFPYGLFVCAVIFDSADVVGGPVFLGEVGYWTAVAALVTAALATVAGLVDLWDVPADDTRHTAINFNVVNAGMAGLFLLSSLVRADATNRGATPALLAVEVLALAVGGVGVQLGARLMRQFEAIRPEVTGVEVVRGLDAPRIEVVRPGP
nr:DUF2231 domain-containing protein [Micromonospora sp. HNM0581]